MGMYTEFHFNVELSKDVPESIILALKYMLNDYSDEYCADCKDSYSLYFNEDFNRYMLLNDSYYFPVDTHSTLRYDDISNSYFLCIRCNLKNGNDNIQQFVSWIAPYINTREDGCGGVFIGFMRYEECEYPTLIFAHNYYDDNTVSIEWYKYNE